MKCLWRQQNWNTHRNCKSTKYNNKTTNKAKDISFIGDFNVNLNNGAEEVDNNNIILKDMVFDTLPLEGFT